jgi:hypothetical protein
MFLCLSDFHNSNDWIYMLITWNSFINLSWIYSKPWLQQKQHLRRMKETTTINPWWRFPFCFFLDRLWKAWLHFKPWFMDIPWHATILQAMEALVWVQACALACQVRMSEYGKQEYRCHTQANKEEEAEKVEHLTIYHLPTWHVLLPVSSFSSN